MKQPSGKSPNSKSVKVDVMLSNIDQRDFLSFYSFEKNPMQKGLMFAVLLIGLLIILFRDRGLPSWAGGIGALAMIVMLIIIWKQRSRAAKMAQATWIVKNRLRILVLDDEGITEWDPAATDDDDDEYEDDSDLEDNSSAEEHRESDDNDSEEDCEAEDEQAEIDKDDEAEDNGKCVENGEDQQGSIVRQGTWDSFPNAFENNRHFYIFLDDLEAFILQKTRMSEALSREVHDFILEKMGERFHSNVKQSSAK